MGEFHPGLHGSGSGLESNKLCILKDTILSLRSKEEEENKIIYLEWNGTVPDGMFCINKYFLR